MSFWTSHPDKSTTMAAENFAYGPSGGRVKMWLLGIGLALVPAGYGVQCIVTGQARFFGRRGAHLDVQGPAATALGIAYIAVGVFMHAHWFWGLHRRLVAFSELLKILAVVVFLGSFGWAVYRVLV